MLLVEVEVRGVARVARVRLLAGPGQGGVEDGACSVGGLLAQLGGGHGVEQAVRVHLRTGGSSESSVMGRGLVESE